jgi:hypothetical protein
MKNKKLSFYFLISLLFFFVTLQLILSVENLTKKNDDDYSLKTINSHSQVDLQSKPKQKLEEIVENYLYVLIIGSQRFLPLRFVNYYLNTKQ